MDQKCELGPELGSGSYGKVYLSKDQNSVIKMVSHKSRYSSLTSISEIDILFNLSSDHLLKGISFCRGGMEMELLNGSYYDMTVSEVTSYSAKKKLLYHAALGIQCLHHNKYLHLDIKLDNLLYSGDLQSGDVIGKVIDFGYAEGYQDMSI